MKSDTLSQFSSVTFPEFREQAPSEPKTKSRHAITIARPVAEVVDLITQTPEVIYALAGAEMRLEESAPKIFDLQIGIHPDHITFESSKDLDFKVKGDIRFSKGPNGASTVLTVSSDYSLPGGKLQEWLKMFAGNDPDTVILVQMKRLKAFLETGEIPTTQGQPSGRDEETQHTVH